MIVKCATYKDGVRTAEDLGLGAACAATRVPGSFAWVGVVDPTREEFDSIAEEFHLHELAVDDAVKAHQRPKAELYGDTLFVVVKTARYVDPQEVIELGELMIFVNPQFIITVRHGATQLAKVRHDFEHHPELLRRGPGMVLYAILDHVVDTYEAAADGVDVDVQEVERQVFAADGTNPAERIYKLEREVLDFYGAVRPLSGAVEEICSDDLAVITAEMEQYFRDVHDHLRRVEGRIGAFRELLGSALHANLAQLTVRQNEDTRKISAWVAILAVPTMIAAIYGMNFRHMPELGWRFGYPAVLVLILAICAYLHRRFKQTGWL